MATADEIHVFDQIANDLKANRRDENAWRKLVRRFTEPLYRFAYSQLRSAHDAEDLVQQLFVDLLRSGFGDSVSGAHLNAFMFHALHNDIIDWKRKRRLPLCAMPEYPIIDPSAADAAAAAEMLEEAQCAGEALKTLNSEMQEAINLRIWGELSIADIAEILGTREGTVKSWISRGYAAIRKELVAKHASDAVSPIPPNSTTTCSPNELAADGFLQNE